MKNTKWLSLALVAVFAVACDPYDDVPGGDPRATGVLATSGIEATLGEASGTDWTLTDVTAACDAGDREAGQPAAGRPLVEQNSVFVSLNRQIDGGIIQTAPDDCTPAGGWLTGTAPAGLRWYSCYSPSSPSPNEGGNVVLFLAPEPSDGGTPADPSDDVLPASGWGDGYDSHGFSFVPASGEAVTTYTVSGERLTELGVGTITINVAPNPGDAMRFNPVTEALFLEFSGVTQTSVTVAIDAACATPTTTYTVERAPNVVGQNGAADAPGTFAVLGEGLAGPTYTDTGLTAGTKYWYRVTANTASGYSGTPVRDDVTTAAP